MSTPVPSRDAITAAYAQIRAHLRRTPVADVELDDRPITLKLEQLQHAGTFKARGAFLGALSGDRPEKLVAASGGNHGMAVAYVGQALGIPTEIFVPAIATPVKVAAIQRLGATVRVGGENYAAAYEASRDTATQPGVRYLHAYDGEHTVTGQATVGLELAEQAPAVDHVLVAVGGGGLAGGIAAWYAGQAGIVAVEPQGCPCLHDALAAGRPVTAPVGGLAADSLGASTIGDHGFTALAAAGATSVLVTDDAIAASRRWLWQELRLVVEPAGAAALAALQSGAWTPPPDSRVAVVLCGANTDPADLIAE